MVLLLWRKALTRLSAISSSKSFYRNVSGIYIHIPFCKCRCAYCDFYSTTQSAEVRGRYVQALCRELALRSDEWGDRPVTTLYFGGGTPSQLSPDELATILDTVYRHYAIHPKAEVTIEANPDDIRPGMGSHLQLLGINRISLGVQSLDDTYLRMLQRRHTARAAIDAVRQLADEGMGNISIDLIYALPGQSLEHFADTLRQVLSLPIRHLSAYQLTYEEGTLMTRRRDAGELPALPDDETVRRMYLHLVEQTAAHGIPQYEVSNFARPGYHSRHNASYWTLAPYLGFGPGAHSYDGNRTRRANATDLSEYIKALYPDDTALSPQIPPHDIDHLDDEQQLLEAIMLGLRTVEGIHPSRLAARFPGRLGTAFHHTLRIFADSGHLVQYPDDRMALAPSGMLVSDYIIGELAAALDSE